MTLTPNETRVLEMLGEGAASLSYLSRYMRKSLYTVANTVQVLREKGYEIPFRRGIYRLKS